VQRMSWKGLDQLLESWGATVLASSKIRAGPPVTGAKPRQPAAIQAQGTAGKHRRAFRLLARIEQACPSLNKLEAWEETKPVAVQVSLLEFGSILVQKAGCFGSAPLVRAKWNTLLQPIVPQETQSVPKGASRTTLIKTQCIPRRAPGLWFSADQAGRLAGQIPHSAVYSFLAGNNIRASGAYQSIIHNTAKGGEVAYASAK